MMKRGNCKDMVVTFCGLKFVLDGFYRKSSIDFKQPLFANAIYVAL